MLYVDQGRYAEAAPLLREALAMEPRFAAVRADLVRGLRLDAQAQRKSGREAAAKALEAEAARVEASAPPSVGAAAPTYPRSGASIRLPVCPLPWSLFPGTPLPRFRTPMRLKREAVEALMADKPAGTTLEEALEVFEVFASGTLADEVYVLDDVSGKRIAIAPAALRNKYRKE